MSLAYAQAVNHYGQSGPLAHAAEQSPHQLIECLLAGALSRIAQARRALATGDASARGLHSSRVIDIIGYLDGILDAQAGGELTARLRSLYDYCIRRIFEANTQQDDAAYQEVAELISEVKSAWDQLPSRLKAAEVATS